jgi:hypothetical protein
MRKLFLTLLVAIGAIGVSACSDKPAVYTATNMFGGSSVGVTAKLSSTISVVMPRKEPELSRSRRTQAVNGQGPSERSTSPGRVGIARGTSS